MGNFHVFMIILGFVFLFGLVKKNIELRNENDFLRTFYRHPYKDHSKIDIIKNVVVSILQVYLYLWVNYRVFSNMIKKFKEEFNETVQRPLRSGI